MTNFAELEIPMPDGESCEGWLVKPEDARRGLLLIPDIFGLRPQIRTMAERIAASGVVVLAVNPAWRWQRSPLVSGIDMTTDEGRDAAVGIARPLAVRTPVPDTAADARTWFGVLAQETGAERFGVTGYCRGGLLSLMIAAGNPDLVAACGVFHAAGLASDQPDSPHRQVGPITAEVLLRPGDKDPFMTTDQQQTLADALTEAGVTFTQEVYPGAPHGYTMTDTWAYQEAGAERHYQDLIDLLDRRL